MCCASVSVSSLNSAILSHTYSLLNVSINGSIEVNANVTVNNTVTRTQLPIQCCLMQCKCMMSAMNFDCIHDSFAAFCVKRMPQRIEKKNGR